jgi:hypothetical protein
LFGNWIIFALRYKDGDTPTQMSTIKRPILNQRTTDFGIGELHLAYHAVFKVQQPSIIDKNLTKIKKKKFKHTTMQGREYEEEYISSYRMALRKREYIANRN